MRNATGDWRKGSPCEKVAEDLAGLCFVFWKVELVSNGLGYLAEEISR